MNSVIESRWGRYLKLAKPRKVRTASDEMLPRAAKPRNRMSWVVIVIASRTRRVATPVAVNSRSRERWKIMCYFDFCSTWKG